MADEMDVFDAIMHRRTCRQFTNAPVDFDIIAQIIDAGMQAPSSGNLQNWQFIVVTEKKLLRELYDHTLEQDAFMSAPIGVIVCSDDDTAEKFYGLRGKRLYAIQNCAACMQNMLLAAHAFGIGACWVGAFDEESVNMMFSIPGTARVQGILLFGHPAEEPQPKERKELASLIFFNKYGERVKKPHLVFRDYSQEWELRARDIKEKMQQKTKSLPPAKEVKEKVAKQSKDFFDNAQKKLDGALQSLKDEEKVKRRKK